MELEKINHDYLKDKINYVLVRKSSSNATKRLDETGLFTWNGNIKLRENDNKILTTVLAVPSGATSAIGVLAGIAGLVFVGGATFSGNQQHAEMGAQALQTAGDILKFGLESAVAPASIFGFSVCSSWYKKINNNRVEKRESAIRTQRLIKMMTGARSRGVANKDAESYKIAMSLYQKVDLSKMRKNMLLELLSSLAAFKEQEDLLREGQTKEETVAVVRNNFFQTYCRILDTKDCPRDLATNDTIHSIMRIYGEKERQELERQEQEAAREEQQKIIDIAKARRLLELKSNIGMAPSTLDQMTGVEAKAVVGIPRRR